MRDEISPYDRIAALYDRFWRDWYLPAALPALQTLFFDAVPAGCAVLDVCCGSGHVTAEIVRRGYRVTGVDLSAELIRIARQHVPAAEFLVQDVREMQFPNLFDAALSTFDAFNHLLSLEDLEQAFAATRRALKPGALLVFDMNVEEAYSLDLQQWNVRIEDDAVSLLRGTFDPLTQLAETQLLWFLRDDNHQWERRDSTVLERCYTENEIFAALVRSGFTATRIVPSRDVGVAAELGLGRLFVTARTPR